MRRLIEKIFPARRLVARELGLAGERRAGWHYRWRGYSILDRNVRFGHSGELDLVVRRGKTVAFVEVKARQTVGRGRPDEAVDAKKQLQLIRLADRYVRAHRLESSLIRFDVLALYWTGRRFQVIQYESAFQPMAQATVPWRDSL
ncbi:MAG: YraN family protein [Acidobacteriota bacterium]